MSRREDAGAVAIAPCTLAELVDDGARRWPDRPLILLEGGRVLTYRGLREQAEVVWSSLAGVALGPHSRVAIVAGAWGATGLVAEITVATACTAVPINAGFTEREMTDLIRQARVDAVIADVAVAPQAVAAAEQLGCPLVRLTPGAHGPAGRFTLSPRGAPGAKPAVLPTADDLAFIGSTTGTTARPKLFGRHHRWAVQPLEVPPGVDVSQLRPLICFPTLTVGVFSMLAQNIAVGSELVLPAGPESADILGLIQDLEVTHVACSPPVLRSLVAAAKREPARASACGLSAVYVGASNVEATLVSEAEARLGVPVCVMYGMSEVAIASMPPGMASRKPGSVGVSSGPEILILGDEGVADPGRAGEVLVRDPSVIDGYLDDEASTAAAFWQGWFRTGDLGYLDEDGYLFITGRLKEQINRGGQKVSPYEVEGVLREYPGVEDAAVFGIPHRRLGEEVGAAVVGDAALTEGELRDHALKHLAEYKVPRRVVFVESVAREMGKVPRVGMAQRLGLGAGASRPAGELPLNDEERAMARIWADLLDVDGPVWRDDDFFELGGDSLLSVEMLLEVERQLGVSIPESHLIGGARLQDLAAVVSGPSGSADAGVLVQVQPGDHRVTPFFWIPGAGDSIVGVPGLAMHLGSNRPVYTFDLSKVEFIKPGQPRLEEMASCYVSAIRGAQAGGPYLVGGCSSGGAVAYEIGRQLQACGERAALVAMLDTAFAVPHGAFYAARQRAAYFLGAGPREKLYSLRRFAARHAPRPVLDTYATMVSLALRYAPRPYDGHVIYFLADRPMDRLARSKWASLAPGMEFCTVPGNHAECLSEPLLGAFGATLRGCLDKADAPMAASVGEARSPA